MLRHIPSPTRVQLHRRDRRGLSRSRELRLGHRGARKELLKIGTFDRYALKQHPNEQLDVCRDGFLVGVGVMTWVLVREFDTFGALNLLDQLEVIHRAEGGFADRHFVQNSAHGPEVSFDVKSLVPEDLWCRI